MTEQQPQEQKLEAFTEQVRDELELFYELFKESDNPGETLPIDPINMGFGNASFDELSQREQEILEQEVHNIFLLCSETRVFDYTTTDPNTEEEIDVSLHSIEEGAFYVHEFRFKDGAKKYQLTKGKQAL